MCEWQRLRSSLNHDWLKNEYLKNLDGLIVQMQTTQYLDSKLGSQMRAYLSGWTKRHQEMEELLNTAEDRLSTRTFFEIEPLVSCSPEHKVWLVPLIHGLWLSRYGVRERIGEARKMLSEADQSHRRLESEFLSNGDVACITGALEAFTDVVKQLSRLISGFPDKAVAV